MESEYMESGDWGGKTDARRSSRRYSMRRNIACICLCDNPEIRSVKTNRKTGDMASKNKNTNPSKMTKTTDELAKFIRDTMKNEREDE